MRNGSQAIDGLIWRFLKRRRRILWRKKLKPCKARPAAQCKAGLVLTSGRKEGRNEEWGWNLQKKSCFIVKIGRAMMTNFVQGLLENTASLLSPFL